MPSDLAGGSDDQPARWEGWTTYTSTPMPHQPARQPEARPSSLVDRNHALDAAARSGGAGAFVCVRPGTCAAITQLCYSLRSRARASSHGPRRQVSERRLSATSKDPPVWDGRQPSRRAPPSWDLLLERVLRAIMDISAPAISLADRPHAGPFGSPVFACAGKTEPPSRLIFSQTLAGKRLDYLRMIRPPGACSPRSLDHELARSRRYARACWQARSQARYGAVASWRLRSRA